MAGLTQDYNQANAEMTSQPPNLDQIIQLQRLALRKSEVTQELTNLMVRFPKGIPSIEAAAKIQEAAKHLDDSQAILVQVNQDLQKMMQTPSADTAQAAPVVPAAAKVGP